MVRNTLKAITGAMRRALSRTPGGALLAHVPGAPALYRQLLWRRGGINQFWGAFQTQEQALAAVPGGLRQDWDDDALHGFLKGQPSIEHSLGWIAQHVRPGGVVLDFGGQLGWLFYEAQARGILPEDLAWIVIEVPAAVAKGRAEALRRGERRLRFSVEVPTQASPDLVIAAGAVQYVFADFSGFLGALGIYPRAILLNKLPLHGADSFWTLQNLGASVTPYRIYRDAEYLGQIAAAGYGVRARWAVEEIGVDIPFRPDLQVKQLSGLMLERAAGA